MIIGNNGGIGSIINQDQKPVSVQQPTHSVGIIGLNDTKFKMERQVYGTSAAPSINAPIFNTGMEADTVSNHTAMAIIASSTIENFIVIESKPLNQDIYARSLSLNMTPEKSMKLENLIDRASCKNGRELTEEMLGKTIPDVVEFGKLSGSRVDIVNGWQQSRFRFFLKLKQHGPCNMYYYIQGFSNYLDNSMLKGALDETHLEFYINSIIETIEGVNSMGQAVQKINRNINVLNNGATVTFQEIDNRSRNRIARPEDIYTVMTNDVANQAFPTHDFTSVMADRAASSFKVNNDGVKHFTKMLNASIGAKNDTPLSHSMQEDTLRKATDNVYEAKLTEIAFIKSLSSLYSVAPAVKFNLRDMMVLFKDRFRTPTVIIDTTIKATDTVRSLGFNVGIDGRVVDSNNMHELFDASVETSMAYSLHSKLATYMSEMRLGKLTVTMSNMNISNEIFVEAFGESLIESDSDADFIQKLENIKYKCKTVLFNEISKNRERAVSVLVDMDWLGKTVIAIEHNNGLGGNNLKTYSFPTYADSLFAPVVGDEMHFKALVQDYTNVLESIF